MVSVKLKFRYSTADQHMRSSSFLAFKRNFRPLENPQGLQEECCPLWGQEIILRKVDLIETNKQTNKVM